MCPMFMALTDRTSHLSDVSDVMSDVSDVMFDVMSDVMCNNNNNKLINDS